MKDYLQESLTDFKQDTERAKAYLSVGETSWNSNHPAVEVAAYALLANMIFNLDEAINRG